ncbi:MAG: hypothetical protein PHW29_04370 [Flavobacterium sp.]|nr:hypothetical protein [Flavobacterium sp.]
MKNNNEQNGFVPKDKTPNNYGKYHIVVSREEHLKQKEEIEKVNKNETNKNKSI